MTSEGRWSGWKINIERNRGNEAVMRKTIKDRRRLRELERQRRKQTGNLG